MKKISLLSLFFLLIIFIGVCKVSASQLSLQLISNDDLSSLKPEDVFNVQVKLMNCDSIVGGEIKIIYDSSLISLIEKTYVIEGITDFSSLENVNNPNLEDIPGQARLIFGIDSSNTPLSENIAIANLSFKAKTKGTGTISIMEGSRLVTEDKDGNLNSITLSSTSIDVSILGTGSIYGVVKDEANNCLSNVNIKVIRDDTTLYDVSTSHEGNYHIVNIVEGSYILKASYDGYKEYQQSIVISEGTNTEFNIIMKKAIHSYKGRKTSPVHKVSSHPQSDSVENNKKIMKIKDGDNILKFGNITIFVPEGALDVNSTVTITIDNIKDDDIVNVYDILLSDKLRKYATLMVNVEDIPEDKVKFIYKYDIINQTWRCLGGQSLDNNLCIPLYNSGSFAVFAKNKNHSFCDIKGHWAEKWIEYLNLMEVIDGKNENFFFPEEAITRSEIAKILDLCLHWDIPSSVRRGSFEDEDDIPKWSKPHVDNLVAKGIICGYDNNTFKPNNKVTREELAVFLDRIVNKYIKVNDDIENFKDDDDIPHWCKSSVYRMKGLGILCGYKDNTFKGKNTITRAESCKAIVKLLEVMNYL